jgi:hypothetical protein
MLKKFLIVAIALLPFIIAHAETTPTPTTEKAATPEVTAPQGEKAKEDKVAEKPKANTSKKKKMGKAGGKGG